ncbi:sensor histidine kinase [Herbidospora mongoliensis]|uniref:sensor histidine kinase n=1 Tax=Herbidospora mongoliensis TaxID=688067 RepID=UPI00082F82EB|nr:histidine kinase [Herbidospora mongoliensis]
MGGLELALLVGTGYLLAGVVGWLVQPRYRVGPLLVAVGVLWLFAKLGPPVPVVSSAWAAVLGHWLITFPTGRAESTAQRVGVAVVYGALPFAGLVVGGVAVIAVQVHRWWGSAAARRRVFNPVTLSGLVALVVVLGLKPVADDPLAADILQIAVGLVPVGYLAGLRHRRIADLVIRLGDVPAGGIEAELAATLRDPTLRVGYWASDRYVDMTGKAIDVPEGRATRVDRAGERLAVLVHDPVLFAEPELIEAACAAAGLALWNERLAADLRLRIRQAGRATEAERRRIERDLHDGVQQRLLAIPMTLSLAEASRDPVPLIREARHALLAVLDDLRALTQGIHPPMLTERGLTEAVKELAALSPVPVRVTADVGGLPPEVETAAYYVVAEGLANVTKHADATEAVVRVVLAGGVLSVEIRDDGVGGADPSRGSGLRGLADRVAVCGGSFHVTGDGGTVVKAVLPCG